MHISQLYTYPIKSLRGVSLSEATLTRTGFQYDRRFMLLKVIPGENGASTLKNMHVPYFPEMALFTTDIIYPDEERDEPGRIIVTYHPPEDKDNVTKPLEIEIPLQPDIRGLRQVSIEMHQSPTTGYDMGNPYNEWFSERFGYEVVLAYLGPHSRRVLGSFAPGKSPAHATQVDNYKSVVSTRSLVGLAVLTLVLNGVRVSVSDSASGPMPMQEELLRHWPGFAATVVAGLLSWVLLRVLSDKKEETITFADTAPYLLTSETSLDELSARFAGDERMDMTKFRPNIVVSGAATAFQEDFWAELRVGQAARLLLTANCVRCQSINVDYATGKMGKGETGSALKKLMKDRRVDKGAKYSPVFGRYVFLDRGSDKVKVRVGDEVDVVRTMKERTVYDWPGLAN